MFEDLKPAKIDLSNWSQQFRMIDNETIKKFCYYRNPTWGIYLSPPATFMVYGARELKRLKFDNSFAALRLWGFVFTETERLFRARQIGKKIIATMGDLGTIPVIVQSFPDCIPFYPECIWWTPFFRESTELLDCSSKLGIPEAACFSKAALAAFFKRSYFPKPDLIIASTGASCDDYSCIMQLVENLGYELFWVEIPYRRKPKDYLVSDNYEYTTEGVAYPSRFEKYLVNEYQRIRKKMTELTGVNEAERLNTAIKKANRLRDFVEGIKRLSCEAEIAPLPALELMAIEFGNLYGYADFDEWLDIVEMVHNTVKERVRKNIGVLKPDAVPIAWITPSADPFLLNLVEDLGCRVVATEYVINQALVKIDEDIDPVRNISGFRDSASGKTDIPCSIISNGVGPMKALARAFLQASLIGSTEERVKRIKTKVEAGRVQGVLITNMLGASHCAMETRLIEKLITDVPVLSIDVPAPFGITEQIKTRIEAFVETIRSK